MLKEIFETLKANSDKQTELLESIAKSLKKDDNKTLKMLGAIGPIFSGILIAAVGWYFTNTHNKQELKLAQIGVIEKFAPQLQDTSLATRLAALSTILSLDDEDLAIRTVSILEIQDRSTILSKLFNASVYTKDYSLLTRILRLYHGVIMLDDFGRSPLIIAIDNKDLETVKFLVDHGFEPNEIVSGKPTPLYEASSIGESKIVQFLLEKKANPNIPDANGNTPLINAVDKSNIDVIKVLLATKGVNIEHKNFDKENALLTAVKFRLYEQTYPSDKIVELLLNAGADLNVHSAAGNTPILECVSWNHFESFRIIFDRKLKNKDSSDINLSLIKAVEQGNELVVKYLLNNHISPNIKTSSGLTLLHLVNDNPEVAELLINAKLDVNAKTKTGETVLHSLLDHVMFLGVTQPEREKYNKELNAGILKVLNLLIKAGVNVNEYSEHNELPLNIAALYRNPQIVETLLKNGASVNLQGGRDSATALIDASSMGRWENVEVLLKYQADKNIKNKNGQTALDVATESLKFYKNNVIDPSQIEKYETTIQVLRNSM